MQKSQTELTEIKDTKTYTYKLLDIILEKLKKILNPNFNNWFTKSLFLLGNLLAGSSFFREYKIEIASSHFEETLSLSLIEDINQYSEIMGYIFVLFSVILFGIRLYAQKTQKLEYSRIVENGSVTTNFSIPIDINTRLDNYTFDLIRDMITNTPEQTKQSMLKNFHSFIQNLEILIQKNQEKLRTIEFFQPDAQKTLYEAAKSSCLKGEKIDLKLLALLVMERVKIDNDSFVELLLEEGVSIVTQIIKEEILFLTLIYFLTEPKLIFNDFTTLKLTADKVFKLFDNSTQIQKIHIRHLQSKGLIFINEFKKGNIFSKLEKKYKDILVDSLKKSIPNLYLLANYYDTSQYYDIELTAVGSLIGLSNLKSVYPECDIHKWFKNEK